MKEFQLTASQMNFYAEEVLCETALWNQGAVVLFKNRPSCQRLNDAMNCLVETHDILRMRITQSDSGSVSSIEEFCPKHYPVLSLGSRQEIVDTVREYVKKPINFQSGLFRCYIFDSPEGAGYIIIVHHIISDGYSPQVMVSFIEQYLNGEPLKNGDVQTYAEYIETERKYRNSRRYERDQQYWIEQCQEHPYKPLFSDRTVGMDYTASELIYDVSGGLLNKVAQFGKDRGVSTASFFNAVLGTYLFQVFECTDLAIGLPVLNRTTVAELNSVGLYMHVLPLAIKMKDEPFNLCVKAIEQTKMDLFRHRKFTQHEIRAALEAQGNGERRLFDVTFDYQTMPEHSACELWIQYSDAVSVPIEVHLHSCGISHKLIVRYRTQMFSAEEIREMCRCILNISEYAVEHPDTLVSNVPRYRLTDQEKYELLGQLNATEHRYPCSENETIYSLFDATVRANPEKYCIEYRNTHTTFDQLWTQAERIDCTLRQVTHGKKSIVAILAERSVEMYAAIYGVIRGGNAYLPIAPDYPQDRIDYLLRNSGAAAVLAQRKFMSLAGDVPCISIEDAMLACETEATVLPCAAMPTDTAYVIYTSGSTGQPKGARISHRSAVNRILWMQAAYPMERDSVILQKTPYTFDVSVWELFWWGMCGGSLAVSAPNEHFLPVKILEAVQTYKVTHLHFVPSVFDVFLTYLETHTEQRSCFNSVRHVFLSGEALAASLVRRFYMLFSENDIGLHNLYGPTECTVDVTFHDCVPNETDPVPIGRPIYNTQIYVLGKDMQLLPKGIKGELCIGGRNVGQGYLNAPVLTAEKFVANPFGPGRLYKSGDLAYIREDGEIIFCGRMDNQIKLNGQRIELGEIETVIRNVAGVETSAVVLCRSGGRDILAAYYCGEPELEGAIQAECAKKLPAYMVPSMISCIDSMPLNQSGKLDRKALMQLKMFGHADVGGDCPKDNLERYVCEQFAKVLKVSDIGRDSNFFSLGGGSIEVIELLSEEKLQGLSVADFLENPTPSGVAEKVRAGMREKEGYVKCLRKATQAGSAIVLFPYAGGGAEVFTRLVNAEENISWYYVDYPHSFEACQNIAEELEIMGAAEKLYIYAHCAGSAAALQVTSILESRGTTVAERFIVGASIPPSDPQPENFWHNVSDEMLKSVLIKAGAEFEMYPEEQVAEMLRRFREDTDFMTEVFAHWEGKITCPTSVIISKRDIFTENHEQANCIWKRYGENIGDTLFIESDSHYFQAKDAEKLMELIRGLMAE